MSDASQFLIPRGFRFGATKAGLKKSGRTDFALIVADQPASAAAAFTANRVIAAPLIVDKEHLRATGGGSASPPSTPATPTAPPEKPAWPPRAPPAMPPQASSPARRAGFPSSTGIIGVPLPAEKLIAALPALAASLGSEFDHFQQVAQAILTTDTVEKTAFARLESRTGQRAKSASPASAKAPA
jgi:glutamate N-acetyltransferase/amino-acid N-acetyltransferase